MRNSDGAHTHQLQKIIPWKGEVTVNRVGDVEYVKTVGYEYDIFSLLCYETIDPQFWGRVYYYDAFSGLMINKLVTNWAGFNIMCADSETFAMYSHYDGTGTPGDTGYFQGAVFTYEGLLDPSLYYDWEDGYRIDYFRKYLKYNILSAWRNPGEVSGVPIGAGNVRDIWIYEDGEYVGMMSFPVFEGTGQVVFCIELSNAGVCVAVEDLDEAGFYLWYYDYSGGLLGKSDVIDWTYFLYRDWMSLDVSLQYSVNAITIVPPVEPDLSLWRWRAHVAKNGEAPFAPFSEEYDFYVSGIIDGVKYNWFYPLGVIRNYYFVHYSRPEHGTMWVVAYDLSKNGEEHHRMKILQNADTGDPGTYLIMAPGRTAEKVKFNFR
jgi:hypothetical protein